MELWEIIIIAIGLSMDAFAVAICKGLSTIALRKKHCLVTGAWFGFFQGAMPVIGYFIGTQFEKYITSVDHWITFILLGLIGANMIREALSKDEEETCGSFGAKAMFPLAIATSIDALAVGVTFAFLRAEIWLAVILIAAVTFALSALGVKIGNIFGARYKAPAEITGGVVLILIGLKILLEHLGIIG